MARRLSKLDRMSIAESQLSDDGLEDTKDSVQEVVAHLENFEDQRETAVGAFTEAASYHEERDWESRDSSLDEAQTAVEEMSSALDEIEVHQDVIILPEGRMEILRKTISEIQEHLGYLL